MSAPSRLLDTHPRLGMALLAAYWEADKTGDWPGERVCEVLSITYERERCAVCGALERRHVIRARLLVGMNAGHRSVHYWQRRTCCHASTLSNYRRPW